MCCVSDAAHEVCCSVLQCCSVLYQWCCSWSVLQCVAACCSALVCCSLLCQRCCSRFITVWCTVLHCAALCCDVCHSVLQCIAVCCANNNKYCSWGVHQREWVNVYMKRHVYMWKFACNVYCLMLMTPLMRCVASRALQFAAVYCSELQCVAMSCNVLQCAAVCCRVLQSGAVCSSVFQCVPVCSSVLQCLATLAFIAPMTRCIRCAWKRDKNNVYIEDVWVGGWVSGLVICHYIVDDSYICRSSWPLHMSSWHMYESPLYRRVGGWVIYQYTLCVYMYHLCAAQCLTYVHHTYNTLQHTATHCNTLQHTATHCNTLQHTMIISHGHRTSMVHILKSYIVHKCVTCTFTVFRWYAYS